MLNRFMSRGVALVLLAVASPAAAQYVDPNVDPDVCSMAEFSCQQAVKERDDKRAQDNARYDAAAAAEGELRKKLLRLPPLPDEQNGLLGSWRQENGGQLGMFGSTASTGGDMVSELWEALQSDPNKLLPSRCVLSFGNGVTFAPSTYSSSALDGSRPGGSIAYRSGGEQVVWVIPDNLKPMPFKIAGPDRILLGMDGSCAMVRVGAPAANAAANAATGPSATPAAVAAAAPFKSVKEQLGVDTIASVERDIKARGGSPGSIRAGSQGIATLSTLSGDYSDAGPYVTSVNYDFDGTGPAARLVAVTVVHSFGVYGDAYKKLTDERKAVLAKDFGALKVKSATESSGAASGYELTLFENPDTGFFYERYKRAH